MENSISDEIRSQVAGGIPTLSAHLRAWIDDHLIEPRQIQLRRDPGKKDLCTLWLVTDHNGKNDSSCRIVYDPKASSFGLEQTLANGVEWYMGNYGTFSETVENM